MTHLIGWSAGVIATIAAIGLAYFAVVVGAGGCPCGGCGK